MKECEFCKIDRSQIYNTIIEETKSFYIKTSLGSLVEGYLLVISKRHINSMRELNENEKREYLYIIKKYTDLFFEKYRRFPIIFEHGTSKKTQTSTSSSIVHAHSHIVNHNYSNEEIILKSLNLKMINSNLELEKNNKSYIYYISPTGKHYITYSFKPISQIMRIFIAKDLNIEENYDWRKYPFTENIINTINKLK